MSLINNSRFFKGTVAAPVIDNAAATDWLLRSSGLKFEGERGAKIFAELDDPKKAYKDYIEAAGTSAGTVGAQMAADYDALLKLGLPPDKAQNKAKKKAIANMNYELKMLQYKHPIAAGDVNKLYDAQIGANVGKVDPGKAKEVKT